MSKQVFLDAPNVGELEKKYLIKAIDSGFVSSVGPLIDEFESKISEYIGIKKAVSVQSGTQAIHMALYELGIGPGDEVIIPALTFIATANPIRYVGAAPVFVDVDRETWNISPKDIERHLTERTKAVLPVHLYGNPCNMDEICEIAKKNKLHVIEDATESLGATYKKKHMGGYGDMGCLSFNGNKIITTGGGGMVVGKDVKRLEHIRFLINQAKSREREGYCDEIGFNYRLTNIEAAMGLAQLEQLNTFLEKKRTFNEIYRRGLSDIECVEFQESYKDSQSSFWFTAIKIKDVDIDNIIIKLKKDGIPCRRTFVPLVELEPYKGLRTSELENSYEIYGSGLCLPSSTLNSYEDIDMVSKKLKEII